MITLEQIKKLINQEGGTFNILDTFTGRNRHQRRAGNVVEGKRKYAYDPKRKARRNAAKLSRRRNR